MINSARHNPPDIWARHTRTHQISRDGVSWTYVEPGEDVSGLDLEYIDRPVPSSSDYMIALTIQNNRDVPVLIGVSY